jgi:hypothetical protein
LIGAANKYELIRLKMAVENLLVQERIINKVNVSDYILFADAQSCALLKEYAISFLLLHSSEVLKSEHSKRLRESGEVLSEIVILLSGSGDDKEDPMTVNELRKELGKRKLDVDGSKEALVSRLNEARGRRQSDWIVENRFLILQTIVGCRCILLSHDMKVVVLNCVAQSL